MTLRTAIFAVAGTTLSAAALAQPANDFLSSPISIGVPGTIVGSTAQATNDFGLVGSCGNSAYAKDVWYRFDCTTSQTVEFATCDGTLYNSVLQVFTISQVGLSTEVACNDNACATQARVSFPAQAGTSYMIRVAGSGNAGGAFTLTSSVPVPRTPGPDVTIGDLSDVDHYGTGTLWQATSAGAATLTGYRGYAVGTNSWNLGDVPVEWQSANQLHPVIGQQMYRYKNGRFEMLGFSWLKHGFLSTNSGAFPEMGACDSPPSGGAELGVNCSDLYGAGLNGSRSYLGPRYDVNPTSGVFTYPWTPLVGSPAPTDNVSRRLAVLDADVAPASNAGADYYVDCEYTTQDDAQWSNGRNNYSMRKLNGSTLLNVSPQQPAFIGNTVRRMTALEYWALEKTGAGDQGINLTNLLFHERTMNVTDKWRHWTSSQPDAAVLPAAQWTTFASPIQARYIIASRVSPNGEGWNYDYMVMNINSNRAGGSFAVRTPAGPAPTGIGTNIPKYHSGDRVLNNPWITSTANGRVSFNVDPATADIDVPGRGVRTFGPNALQWGTMYNFRFTSNAAPVTGVARLGLFRAPTDTTGFQGSSLAIGDIKVPGVCTADVGSTGGLYGPDGTLDNNDFVVFIDAFFNNDMLMADVGKTGGAAGPDNTLDNNDFVVYIDAFFTGCV